MNNRCAKQQTIKDLSWGGDGTVDDSKKLCTIAYSIAHLGAKRREPEYESEATYPGSKIVTLDGNEVPVEIEQAEVALPSDWKCFVRVGTNWSLLSDYEPTNTLELNSVNTNYIITYRDINHGTYVTESDLCTLQYGNPFISDSHQVSVSGKTVFEIEEYPFSSSSTNPVPLAWKLTPLQNIDYDEGAHVAIKFKKKAGDNQDKWVNLPVLKNVKFYQYDTIHLEGVRFWSDWNSGNPQYFFGIKKITVNGVVKFDSDYPIRICSTPYESTNPQYIMGNKGQVRVCIEYNRNWNDADNFNLEFVDVGNPAEYFNIGDEYPYDKYVIYNCSGRIPGDYTDESEQAIDVTIKFFVQIN